MQLQNLFWVWLGDFSFPKDTPRLAVLTGDLILNLTFKNERVTSASCAAERCSLQKANCESSEGADVSLVMTVPICTKFTFPLICVLGQIPSCHGPGIIHLGSLVPSKELICKEYLVKELNSPWNLSNQECNSFPDFKCNKD